MTVEYFYQGIVKLIGGARSDVQKSLVIPNCGFLCGCFGNGHPSEPGKSRTA